MNKFRTQTGQTGRNAYLYELTHIDSARRRLDRRFNELRAAIVLELPADAMSSFPIPSEAYPDARLDIDREGIARRLAPLVSADRRSVEQTRDLVRHMTGGI